MLASIALVSLLPFSLARDLVSLFRISLNHSSVLYAAVFCACRSIGGAESSCAGLLSTMATFAKPENALKRAEGRISKQYHMCFR